MGEIFSFLKKKEIKPKRTIEFKDIQKRLKNALSIKETNLNLREWEILDSIYYAPAVNVEIENDVMSLTTLSCGHVFIMILNKSTGESKMYSLKSLINVFE